MNPYHDTATSEQRRHDRIHRSFIVERELAERWRKSIRTIQRMRVTRTGPAYLRIGGSILYRMEDIEAFEFASRVSGEPT